MAEKTDKRTDRGAAAPVSDPIRTEGLTKRYGPTLAVDRLDLTVRAGEVLVIPSNLPHRALALEDTLDVDIFDPPRQDWLAGTDTYLRG